MYARITWPVGACVVQPTAAAVAAVSAIPYITDNMLRDAGLTKVSDGGRLKTRDWKTRDHFTGGGKRETNCYGTPNV